MASSRLDDFKFMPRTKDGSKRPSSGSAQDNFLGELIKSGSEVELYISNGTRIRGAIASYDAFVIVMAGLAGTVYKSAVCLIQPVDRNNRAIKAELPRQREPHNVPTVIVKKRRLFEH